MDGSERNARLRKALSTRMADLAEAVVAEHRMAENCHGHLRHEAGLSPDLRRAIGPLATLARQLAAAAASAKRIQDNLSGQPGNAHGTR